MKVQVLAFARLRELLGPSRELELSAGSTAGDVWAALSQECMALAPLTESTRFARNGRIVDRSEPISDGDEVSLLPPVGGG